MFVKNRVFVHGKTFQPSLMFLGKASSLTLSGASEMCVTQVGSGLIHKYRGLMVELY